MKRKAETRASPRQSYVRHQPALAHPQGRDAAAAPTLPLATLGFRGELREEQCVSSGKQEYMPE